MALSDIDRKLLERCLERKPRAWQDFVDRFMGLVVHVVQHTSRMRSLKLSPEDRDELIAEFFLAIIKDDFAILRAFRGQASLATYLVVIARRVIVKKLIKDRFFERPGRFPTLAEEAAEAHRFEDALGDRDEVQRLLGELDSQEARVVTMYHLEGKSYREISDVVGLAENSIGPTLSRARVKMQRARTA